MHALKLLLIYINYTVNKRYCKVLLIFNYLTQ